MTKISITVFEDAEAWLRENIKDFSLDSIASVYLASPINLDGDTKLWDDESGQSKNVKLADFVQALALLCDQIGHTLFVGGLKSPHHLRDAGNWDAEVVDAFFQLAFHGKVIYG